jgi:hypothetical protein
MNSERLVWLAAAGLMTIAGPAYGQKGKPAPSPCGTGNIPLSVTVYDSPSQLQIGLDPLVTVNGVDPLGYTEYRYEATQSPAVPGGRPVPLVDGGKGSAKVGAVLEIENCAFDFVVNLSSTPRELVASLPLLGAPIDSYFLRFDRIASVPVTTNNATFEAWCTAGIVNASLQTPTPYDNYGGCDVDDAGNRFVRRAAGGYLYEGPARDYRYRFRRSPLDTNYSECFANVSICQASYVRVYHPTVDTWIITPDTEVFDMSNAPVGGDAATVAIMNFVDNNEASLQGFALMPFRMVLRIKQ